MSSAYIGLRVRLTLHPSSGTSSHTLVGRIQSIDASSGILKLLLDDGNTLETVDRSKIAGIEMIGERTANVGASSSSYNQLTVPSGSTPSSSLVSYPPTPSTPQTTSSKASKKRAAKAAAVAAASASLAHAEPPKGPKAMSVTPKKESKAKNLVASQTQANQEYEEDFDFDKALKSFDKKAVWDQIRASDQTDPSLRLHAHNRATAAAARKSSSPVPLSGSAPDLDALTLSSRGRIAAARNPQEKLRADENVLSPSPPPASERLSSHVNGSGTHGTDGIVGGREQEVQGKLELLSALTGIDIALARPAEDQAAEALPHNGSGSNSTYDLTLYTSPQARTKHLSQASASSASSTINAGNLTVRLSGTLSKLRYNGPVPSASDQTLIAALPVKYAKPLGLGGTERAGAFVKRLGEWVAASAAGVATSVATEERNTAD
ncbi:hypothetical protein IE81DRAFT_326420 [Ceraceosorus guamensis]|uniref:DFDF domain-containing protein n=1 Tax=Ceraceosorus guamensis TaxID=1522189 RepID=A0A316VVR6_9BASI|nr:hypothetical protein IE81DRAFT_326420 [Ceraceosorus guamensis]PWN39535.1 hypothetical protein IE81DRAFT_326420 [Ceraceosorus guamensis]